MGDGLEIIEQSVPYTCLSTLLLHECLFRLGLHSFPAHTGTIVQPNSVFLCFLTTDHFRSAMQRMLPL